EGGLGAGALLLGGVAAAGGVAEVGAGAVKADVLGQVVGGGGDGVGYPGGQGYGCYGHYCCWEGVSWRRLGGDMGVRRWGMHGAYRRRRRPGGPRRRRVSS